MCGSVAGSFAEKPPFSAPFADERGVETANRFSYGVEAGEELSPAGLLAIQLLGSHKIL
jgi:hypothetical protein